MTTEKLIRIICDKCKKSKIDVPSPPLRLDGTVDAGDLPDGWRVEEKNHCNCHNCKETVVTYTCPVCTNFKKNPCTSCTGRVSLTGLGAGICPWSEKKKVMTEAKLAKCKFLNKSKKKTRVSPCVDCTGTRNFARGIMCAHREEMTAKEWKNCRFRL